MPPSNDDGKRVFEVQRVPTLVVLNRIDDPLSLPTLYVLPKMHSVELGQAIADPLFTYPSLGPPGGEGRETFRQPDEGELLAGGFEDREPPPGTPPVCTGGDPEQATATRPIPSSATNFRPLACILRSSHVSGTSPLTPSHETDPDRRDRRGVGGPRTRRARSPNLGRVPSGAKYSGRARNGTLCAVPTTRRSGLQRHP